MAENSSSDRSPNDSDRKVIRDDVVSQEIGRRSNEIDTGAGKDFVRLWSAFGGRANAEPDLIRLSFVAGEVGNGEATDSDSNTELLDGGLAVQAQVQTEEGKTIGAISRFDDEGLIFRSFGNTGFVIHDQLTGEVLDRTFRAVALGSAGNDGYNFSFEKFSVYINGGRGNDELLGSQSHDHIAGGSGNDRITGGLGDDVLSGGAGTDLFVYAATPGNDTITDFTPGTDKIDLSAFGITFANLEIKASEDSTLLSVDSNRDGTADFTILLSSVVVPGSSDFVFG